jgi:hypothetical protein
VAKEEVPPPAALLAFSALALVVLALSSAALTVLS